MDDPKGARPVPIERFIAVDEKGKRYVIDVSETMIEQRSREGQAIDLPADKIYEIVGGGRVDVGADGTLSVAGTTRSLKRL